MNLHHLHVTENVADDIVIIPHSAHIGHGTAVQYSSLARIDNSVSGVANLVMLTSML